MLILCGICFSSWMCIVSLWGLMGFIPRYRKNWLWSLWNSYQSFVDGLGNLERSRSTGSWKQTPQGSGHSTNLPKFKECLKNISWSHRVDLVILMGHVQLRMLYTSMNSKCNVEEAFYYVSYEMWKNVTLISHTMTLEAFSLQPTVPPFHIHCDIVFFHENPADVREGSILSHLLGPSKRSDM